MINNEKSWFQDALLALSSSYGIAFIMPQLTHWAIAMLTALTITFATHHFKNWLNKRKRK